MCTQWIYPGAETIVLDYCSDSPTDQSTFCQRSSTKSSMGTEHQSTCMTLTSSAIPAIYIVKYVHLNHMDKAGCKVLESYLHFGGRSLTFHLKSSIWVGILQVRRNSDVSKPLQPVLYSTVGSTCTWYGHRVGVEREPCLMVTNTWEPKHSTSSRVEHAGVSSRQMLERWGDAEWIHSHCLSLTKLSCTWHYPAAFPWAVLDW